MDAMFCKTPLCFPAAKCRRKSDVGPESPADAQRMSSRPASELTERIQERVRRGVIRVAGRRPDRSQRREKHEPVCVGNGIAKQPRTDGFRPKYPFDRTRIK